MARHANLPDREREHLLYLRDLAPRFDTAPWVQGPPMA